MRTKGTMYDLVLIVWTSSLVCELTFTVFNTTVLFLFLPHSFSLLQQDNPTVANADWRRAMDAATLHGESLIFKAFCVITQYTWIVCVCVWRCIMTLLFPIFTGQNYAQEPGPDFTRSASENAIFFLQKKKLKPWFWHGNAWKDTKSNVEKNVK